MKIAFFDHPFHEKTKSSNFFLDIVNALGGVDVFYADFHNEKDTESSLLFCRCSVMLNKPIIF